MLMNALSISMKNSDSLYVQASHSENCIIRLVFHKERSLGSFNCILKIFFPQPMDWSGKNVLRFA